MNCLEFRRLLLIEPNRDESDFVTHRTNCVECAEHAARATQLETQLYEAVAIKPPEALRDQILLAHAFGHKGPRRALPRRWLAIAASLVLGIGLLSSLTLQQSGTPLRASELEVAVFNHVNHGLDYLHAEHNLQNTNLERVLTPFGAVLNETLGHLSYASRCDINHHPAVHLVLPGKQGPVTVFMMPNEEVEQRQSIHSSRYNGIIVPTTYGSMAVIGEEKEALDSVIESLSDKITWTI